jgi:hypothetical protein
MFLNKTITDEYCVFKSVEPKNQLFLANIFTLKSFLKIIDLVGKILVPHRTLLMLLLVGPTFIFFDFFILWSWQWVPYSSNCFYKILLLMFLSVGPLSGQLVIVSQKIIINVWVSYRGVNLDPTRRVNPIRSDLTWSENKWIRYGFNFFYPNRIGSGSNQPDPTRPD